MQLSFPTIRVLVTSKQMLWECKYTITIFPPHEVWSDLLNDSQSSPRAKRIPQAISLGWRIGHSEVDAFMSLHKNLDPVC